MSGWIAGVYRPSLRDLVAQFAPQRVARAIDTNTAAANIVATLYTVPGDTVLLLDSAEVFASGGGAQTTDAVELFVEDTVGNAVCRVFRYNFGDVGLAVVQGRLTGNWTGELVVMPGELLRCSAGFSAGVSSNLLRGSFAGVLVPRGNWQLG